MKSHVTILVCPWCKKEKNELAMDMRIRNGKLMETFEMHTEDVHPCDECMKEAVILFDYHSRKHIGYLKKENHLDAESMEKFKDTPVKMLVTVSPDGSSFQVHDPLEGEG